MLETLISSDNGPRTFQSHWGHRRAGLFQFQQPEQFQCEHRLSSQQPMRAKTRIVGFRYLLLSLFLLCYPRRLVGGLLLLCQAVGLWVLLVHASLPSWRMLRCQPRGGTLDRTLMLLIHQ